ncbi:MAG: SDR family NAD(P)-dependent oxidoreductase [Paracoccus sp. (in: a-proteobacteria)]
MNRLSGKRALVSGAGGDIGRLICARFIEEGARVVATDLRLAAAEAAIADAPQGQSLAVQCDVTDGDSVRGTVARATGFLGGLDIVCPIAGGSSPRDGRVTEASEQEFWRVIQVDLYGTFALCKYAIPELVRSGGGAVITMSSMTASVAIPDRACYSAAKGGVISLTRAMAAGHAAENIRVNAIAPGITLTARVMANLVDHEASKAMVDRHLLGLVEPRDIAEMAIFLASDEARRITGQVFAVDSGVTIS